MKTVSVIGSTGSIGKTALNEIKRLGYKVCSLTANSNLELLKKQADEFSPDVVGVTDTSLYHHAKQLFGDKLVMGRQALTLPCTLKQADVVLVSVVGLNGIYPLLESIRNNKIIALANKECLVAGGGLVSEMLKGCTAQTFTAGGTGFNKSNAKGGMFNDVIVSGDGFNNSDVGGDKSNDANFDGCGFNNSDVDGDKSKDVNFGSSCSKNFAIKGFAGNESLIDSFAQIIPVDSEHSAVFQCLKSGKKAEINKIILTASGGAFYTYTLDRLKAITPKDIFHPNWKMGRKITLDSCTMMNKALEIIEAYWLFGTAKIDYVVHPESIIHALVEFNDGSTMAQLANPDMTLPISYALCYPDRKPGIKPFKFDKSLTFLQKNPLFYAPQLALEVIKIGKSAGTVFNAAGEAATDLFEKGKILFTDIVKIVEKALFMSDIVPINSTDDVEQIHNATINKVNTDYKIITAKI